MEDGSREYCNNFVGKGLFSLLRIFCISEVDDSHVGVAEVGVAIAEWIGI